MNGKWWRMAMAGSMTAALAMAIPVATSAVESPQPSASDAGSVASYWTPQRRAAAQPRDIVVDEAGRSYLRRADGGLVPYGRGTMAAKKPEQPGKPTRVISNSAWRRFDLPIATSSGRLYFEMPDAVGDWHGYVCSASVASDTAGSASILLTAAHCVYDDVNDVYARATLFIPDQAATTASATDLDCTNDRFGCWAPTYGVVDRQWTTHEWPDNVAWDYGFYVVPTSGRHSGTTVSSDSLEQVVGTLAMTFASPTTGASTYAFGYSYQFDPQLRYCAQGLGAVDSVDWWLSRCKLTGGSSGGPWLQPFDETTGTGSVMSVNSWGYIGAPGMAGPRFDGSSADCVLAEAEKALGTAPSSRGVEATCPS